MTTWGTSGWLAADGGPGVFQGGDQAAGGGGVGRRAAVIVWPRGSRRPGGAAAVVLEDGWWLGVELGHEGAGVAGAEPSGGGQLASADRRAVGAEVGVDALGLGALGQHLGAWLLELSAGLVALFGADRGGAAAGSALMSARYSRLSTAKEPSSHTGVAPAVR